MKTMLTVAATLAMLLVTPARAEDKPRAPATTMAAQAFFWADFATLEKENARLREGPHYAADGSSELQQFRVGIDNVIRSGVKRKEPYLRELELQTLEWATDHPKSALAQVLYAQVLVEHAWSYRGHGFAKDVPPEAWEDFRAYLGRALAHLQAHADVAFTDSAAHGVLLRIGRGLNWEHARLAAIADEGLKRNRHDVQLYYDMVTTLLPKWGGDERSLDNYIRQVAVQTRAEFGNGMYALLYSSAATGQFGHMLFRDSQVQWAVMRKGFEDLHARYPDDPARRNRFAYMACLAEDRATLLALIEELGPRLDAAEWGPNGERSLEGCERMARKP